MSKFYVYHLVDPRDGSVFYVGKGTGSRVRAHEVEARKGVTSEKCKRIREIWASGLPVDRRVVRIFEHEIDAYDFERAEIRRLPNLTNVMLIHKRQKVRLSEDDFARLMWLTKASNGFHHAIHLRTAESAPGTWAKIMRMFNGIDIAKVAKDAISQMIDEHGRERVNARARPYGIEFLASQT